MSDTAAVKKEKPRDKVVHKAKKRSLPLRLKKMSYRKDKKGNVTSVVLIISYPKGREMEFSEKAQRIAQKQYVKLKPFLIDKKKVSVWRSFNTNGEIAIKVDLSLKDFKTIIIPAQIETDLAVYDLILRFRRKDALALVSNRIVAIRKKRITSSLFDNNKINDRLLVRALSHSTDQGGLLISGANEGGTVNELLSDVRLAFDAEYIKTLTPFWDFKAYSGLRWHVFSDDLPVNITKEHQAFAFSLGAGAVFKQNPSVKHDFLLSYQNRMLHSLSGSEIIFDLESFTGLKYQPVIAAYRSLSFDFFLAPHMSLLIPAGADYKTANEFGLDLLFFFTKMKKFSGVISYSKGSYSDDDRKLDLETLEFGLGYTFSF